MQGGQTPESSRNRAKAYTVSLKFLLALSWFQIKGFPMPDAVSNYWVIFHVFLYTNLSSHPLNPHKPLASTAKVWFLLVHLMTLNNMLSQKTKQILPIPSSVLAELSPIPPKKKNHLFFRPRSLSLLDHSSCGSHSDQHFCLLFQVLLCFLMSSPEQLTVFKVVLFSSHTCHSLSLLCFWAPVMTLSLHTQETLPFPCYRQYKEAEGLVLSFRTNLRGSREADQVLQSLFWCRAA